MPIRHIGKCEDCGIIHTFYLAQDDLEDRVCEYICPETGRKKMLGSFPGSIHHSFRGGPREGDVQVTPVN